jgi:hypothetical protein
MLYQQTASRNTTPTRVEGLERLPRASNFYMILSLILTYILILIYTYLTLILMGYCGVMGYCHGLLSWVTVMQHP